jgi:phosphinothricin acetyltransferase
MHQWDWNSVMFDVRLAAESDLPAILDISNWAALNTPANFAVEPETLELWQRDYRATREKHPWLVAVGESAAEAAAPGEPGGSTLPLAPSVGGRGKKVLGFAKASPWKGRCAYLWSAETTVYVRPGLHGQGIGTALYGRLIDLLRAQGYRSLVGGITLPNAASVALHESCGFRRVAQFEKIGWKFDRWHDVGYWELLLGDPEALPGPVRAVGEVTEEGFTTEAQSTQRKKEEVHRRGTEDAE